VTGIIRRILRAGAARLVVKAAKATPLIGTAVAIGLIGHEVKKKGLVRGIINTALDATPFVGVTKNAIEMITGDWLPDKAPVPVDQNHASDAAADSHSLPESASSGKSTTPAGSGEDESLATPVRKRRRR